MTIPSEAELIEIEQEMLYLYNCLDYDPDEMTRQEIRDEWDQAYLQAEWLLEQITKLCELTRRRAA
jgi:hypothetical protein